MVLLAKNEIGYKNLIKLTSAGFLEGFYHRPRVDKEILTAVISDWIVAGPTELEIDGSYSPLNVSV